MSRIPLGLVALGAAGLAAVPLGTASAAVDPLVERRLAASRAPATGDVAVRPQGRAVQAVAGRLPPQVAYSVRARNGSAVVRMDPRDGSARTLVAADRYGPELTAEAWSAARLRVYYSLFSAIVDVGETPFPGVDSVPQTGGSPAREVPGAKALDVSHDGESVVYQRNEGASSNLFLAERGGTGERRLTGAGGFAPRFSQDDSSVVFSRSPRGGSSQADLYTIGADGSGIRRVTARADTDDYLGAYSPDGQRVLFTRVLRSSGASSVYSVGVDGQGLRLVRRGAEAPDWAANGWLSYLLVGDDRRMQIVLRAPGLAGRESQLTRETSAITAVRFAR